MAEQTFVLPANRYLAIGSSRGWAWRNALVPGSEGSRPVIDDGLTPATNPPRLITQVFVRSPTSLHAVDLDIGNTQTDATSGRDLSDAFEISGSVTIGVGGVDYTFPMTGSDLLNPTSFPAQRQPSCGMLLRRVQPQHSPSVTSRPPLLYGGTIPATQSRESPGRRSAPSLSRRSMPVRPPRLTRQSDFLPDWHSIPIRA